MNTRIDNTFETAAKQEGRAIVHDDGTMLGNHRASHVRLSVSDKSRAQDIRIPVDHFDALLAAMLQYQKESAEAAQARFLNS